MNENKRIDNPRIKIVKCVTDRRNLSGTRPKLAFGKSSSCRFSFSAARNAITKDTEYVTFSFSSSYFGFFSF